MDNKEFVKELNEFADKNGADILLNFVNAKGSPMENCRIDKVKEIVLNTCRLISATIIPKAIEAKTLYDTVDAAMDEKEE